MSKRRDLTGQRFERLLVLAFAGTDRHGNRLWLCACLCGKQTTAPGRCLIRLAARPGHVVVITANESGATE